MFTHCSSVRNPSGVRSRHRSASRANSNGIPIGSPCSASRVRPKGVGRADGAAHRGVGQVHRARFPEGFTSSVFSFEARKGGSASLLLLTDDLRSELKIEAELADIRETGMQPVVLALFIRTLTPIRRQGINIPSTSRIGSLQRACHPKRNPCRIQCVPATAGENPANRHYLLSGHSQPASIAVGTINSTEVAVEGTEFKLGRELGVGVKRFVCAAIVQAARG